MSENVSGPHVFTLLTRASRAVREHGHRNFQRLGICETDFAVLEALLHKGALPVNEIGRKVLLESGSITAAVDRMEQRGLVARRSHATDRRVRLVELTPEGRRFIEDLFARHAGTLDDLVSVLTPDERATLVGLLRRLGHGARERLETDEHPSEPATPAGARAVKTPVTHRRKRS